jgi:hypothetical protein
MVKQKRSPSMREVFFALCKKVDTPVSLGAWLRFEHDQLALAKMEINPRDYLGWSHFAKDYLVVSFLSKWKGLKTGLDLENEALQKFKSSEDLCRETNRRIRKARCEPIDEFTASVISTARRKISKLLGPMSLFKVEPWWGWGPGATFEIPRRRAFVDTKMSELPFAVTPRAEELFHSVLGCDLHWSQAIGRCETTRVESCRIQAVPKNAKTHRIIAVEPRANSFLQKGIGGYFRNRLKRVGIDLDDQGANQDGAYRAYTDGLATIDLKAASDTVAKEVVYELLPLDWAMLLDDLRTHQAEMPDGSILKFEKFSSMGNGFTFELESLIFWAVVSSVVDLLCPGGDVLIYGDDIICPAVIADDVIECLNFLGFQTNNEKSFTSGNFFESCGKHFFQGKEVTPIYQKETIESEVELLRLGNRLIRYAYRMSDGVHLQRWTEAAWSYCLRSATWSSHFQIPLGTSGDDGWVVPADRFFARRQDLNLGICCKVMVFPSRSLPAHEGVLLAWSLRQCIRAEYPSTKEGDFASEEYTVRGPVTRVGHSPMSSRETGRQEAVIAPDTTSHTPSAGVRWVMPSWEFSLNF